MDHSLSSHRTTPGAPQHSGLHLLEPPEEHGPPADAGFAALAHDRPYHALHLALAAAFAECDAQAWTLASTRDGDRTPPWEAALTR